MKILRISLRNLASLAGTQTVDFTREPLRTAGLFSISGPTGSGKSTLLDALCLALYDATPRLRDIGRLAELDGGEKQNDPRNLLRRGAGEGFAEVAFAGVDGQIYTARWMVRRARSQAGGALQNTEMTLLRGDVRAGREAVIEQGGKKTEVLAVIAQKVGLTFAQFTRAVLLAQNDFATFLKATDHDRAEILQALTGTERFETLSIAVFTRCAGLQREVGEIEARLAGHPPLAPEARAAAEADVARLDAARKDAASQVGAREAHAAWFTRRGELARSVEAAGLELAVARRALEAAARRGLELQRTEHAAREARPLWDAEVRTTAESVVAEETHRRAAQSETAPRAAADMMQRQRDQAATTLAAAKAAFEAAQPSLRQARELDAKLTPVAERLATALREKEIAGAALKVATAKREELREKLFAAEREKTRLGLLRSELKPFATFAPEATAWLDRLDRAVAARSAAVEAERLLSARTNEEREKGTTAVTERAQEAEARKALEAASAIFEKAEAEARACDGEQIATARRAAEETRSALHAFAESLRREELHAEIATLTLAQEADTRTLHEMTERQIPAAQEAVLAARRSFELAEAAVADAAIRLREKLAPEQACPVCGAIDHPYADYPPTSDGAALRVLRADCATQEKTSDALRAQAARLDAAGEGRTKRLLELHAKAAALAAAESFRAEHPAAAAILALLPGERNAGIKAALIVETEKLADLDRADQTRRAREKQRDASRKVRDDATSQLADRERKLRVLAEELATLRAARAAATEARSKVEQTSAASLAELAPLFAAIPESEAAWRRDAGAFRTRFTERSQQWRELEKRANEVEASIAEMTAALGPALETLAVAEGWWKQRTEEETVARGAHETLRQQRAAIFEGRAADAVELEFKDQLRQRTVTHETWAEKLAEAVQLLAASAENHRAAERARTEAIVRRTSASSALDAWLATFTAPDGPPLARGELEKMLARDGVWIRDERAALVAFEGAVRHAEGVLADRQKTLAAHAATQPTEDDEPAVAAALTALRDALLQAEHQRDAARAFLLADDHRLREHAALAAQLAQRRVAAEPWLKLNELIGSADGAKFRGIAQRRTLDILLGCANAQLAQLAARYRLERLPESLNLIVVDRDMGEERRSVHSLSGGESFLVSLALALALASLTSNRVRIESLFIDEGFGSLDPETLNTAMNALMQLEAQGRKVGVISHVTEMADAIPVQIRVAKGRSGASRLVVPGVAAEGREAEEVETGNAAVEAEAAAVAAQILAILQREKAAGKPKISTRALREEIGCEISILNVARTLLAEQIAVEGKSVSLAES